MADEALTEIVTRLSRNRPLAHETLFPHRHPNKTPPFHTEIINLWHGPTPNLCFIAFRGGAKSTLSEEGLCIKAALREFENCIIFGASFELAAQRLHAIRREFEKNEAILQIFGDLRGQPWADDKLEFSSGIVIQAMGRGQSMRGTKEETKRPDFIMLDDIEDRESVRTPESRKKVGDWLFGDVIPAGDYKPIVRMLANDLHPECIACQLKNPDSDFTVKVYPWEYIDDHGYRQATWESRFPLTFIDKKKAQLYSLGRASEYQQEYMCASTSPEDKPFRHEMLRIVPRERTWQGVYAMFDPARTVKKTSATTGFACWSWIGNKLVIWESWGKKLMPDEIVNEIFRINEEYHPVMIGVEEDGLNEFLMQPIRSEAAKRRIMLPVKAMKAPKGKLDFIRGLQPYFNAREIEFACEMPDLKGQLLSFPSGAIDAPNALAYAIKMRSGAPIYDDFSVRHVAEELSPLASRPCWLAMNATPTIVTAVLIQWIDGALRIYADWMREGEPAVTVPDILSEARLEAGASVRPVVSPTHYERYTNVGLTQAIARMPLEIRRGSLPENGRNEVRGLLKRDTRDTPSLMVSSAAHWTLNALSGGYARIVSPQGILADHAEEGIYRTLMEGIESFCGTLASGQDDDDAAENYGYTREGVRYMTTAPHLRSRRG